MGEVQAPAAEAAPKLDRPAFISGRELAEAIGFTNDLLAFLGTGG